MAGRGNSELRAPAYVADLGPAFLKQLAKNFPSKTYSQVCNGWWSPLVSRAGKRSLLTWRNLGRPSSHPHAAGQVVSVEMYD